MKESNPLDDPILDVDICVDRLVIVDHPAPLDQQLVTLQEEYGDREREGSGEKINPDILIDYTISYVILDLTQIS